MVCTILPVLSKTISRRSRSLNTVEEDTVKKKTQESSKSVNSYTSIDNGVYGSVAYYKFNGLLIYDSLDEVNVCALKPMELLSLGKMDKGATYSAAKYKSMNERWFNQKHNNPSTEEVTDNIEDLYTQRDSLIQVRCNRGSAETVKC